jgi:transposase
VGHPAVARCKKNARRWKAWILFYDESGISERPSIRRTWAPRGETPVLIHCFNWKKLLICAALGFRWDGRRHQLWFRTAPGSCNRHRVLEVLLALARHFRGRHVILVWDQLSAHKSGVVRDWLRAQRHWLRVEWLPGYAPDLNPAEHVWGNVKGRELANRCSEDLADAASALRRGMRRIRGSRTLAWAFLRHTGLSF